MARWTRDRAAAALLALAWLVFPPVLLAASAGSNDVPTAAFVALALYLWARAPATAAALAVAAWIKVVPVVALPIWVAGLRGRRLVGALGGIAAVCAVAVVILAALGGRNGVADMLNAMRFQTERGSLHAIWWQFDALWAQRLFEAATGAFVVAAAVLVRLREELRTLPAVASLCATALLLFQLAGNYWNATYLPWTVPLLLAGLFTAPTNKAA